MSWGTELTPLQFDHVVEYWGIVIIVTAAVIEAVAVTQRKLAAKYGWRRWPTISMVFRDDGKQWTSIVFGWGLLAGHWWGPFPRWFSWDFWIWVGSAGVLLTRDLVNRLHPTPLSKKWIFVILLIGILEGAFFWSSGG